MKIKTPQWMKPKKNEQFYIGQQVMVGPLLLEAETPMTILGLKWSKARELESVLVQNIYGAYGWIEIFYIHTIK